MTRMLLTSLGLVTFLGVGALAAIPPRSPQDLKQSATAIVTGEVRKIYTAEHSSREGGVDRLYALEVLVSSVEKGAKVQSGRVIYARAWQPAKRPPGTVGDQGQNQIPEPGHRVRLYLTRDKDGGWDLLRPNGVEALTSK